MLIRVCAEPFATQLLVTEDLVFRAVRSELVLDWSRERRRTLA